MTDDDWMVAAMSDGSLVADLLVHLRRASPSEKKKMKEEEVFSSPPLRWRVRQRRSRPALVSSPKPTPTPTPSPTTPLSWSGATSAAADGVEESSSPPVAAARSKGPYTSENTSRKRSRKKKTLAELKEDEVLVLKERRDLKKELESLRVTVEKERATNDRLKRLKLDRVRSAKEVILPVPTEESPNTVPSYHPFSADLRINAGKSAEQLSLSNPARTNEEATNQENKFVLPDLNLPIEDHTY